LSEEEPSIRDIVLFFGGLMGLGILKKGMDNGNLPKLVDKYLRYFGKLIIENPDFVPYGLAGILGAMIPTTLEGRAVGAGAGMLAVKLAGSGNLLSAGVGLASLAILGLANVPSEIINDMYGETLPEPGRWPWKAPEGWPKFR